MANRWVGTLLAAMLACSYAATAYAEPLQVLYAETFRPQSVQTPGAQKPGASVLRIQAFGGTFELAIEDNSSLLRQASPQARARLSATQLFKGTLRNVPGSWVRLTTTNGVYSGAIWDGNELYAVEPREILDDVLLTPLAGVSAGSAIYRLSDTRGGALQGVCALDTSGDTSGAAASGKPLDKYRSLVRELQAAAASVPREIEVSMIADFEYTSRQGAAVLGRMVNHVNVVDGIFSEQVGVAIVPTDFITFATDSDQFSSSDPSTLLDQLAGFRSSTPAVRSRGLAHLLTGRQLDGDVIGIAFLGALCDEHQGVSLSEASSFVDTPLVMAHEIGHNFGAPHDGQPGSACATTSSSFLMGPFLGNSSQFSPCSLQQMQPVIAGAACVVPARNRDVAVTVPSSTIVAATDQTFTVVADVTSTGSTAAANVLVNMTLPGFGVERLSLSSPGLNCAFTTQGVSCEEPQLAPGETRRISVQLRSATETQFAVTANVSSSNDSNATNNTAATQVTVAIPRDFQITVSPQPITAVVGEPFEMTFDVTSIATRTLNDVHVELTHHGGLTATAATIEGGACTVTGSQPMAVCTLPSLAVGVTRRMRATMVPNNAGTEGTPAAIRAFENGSSTGQRVVEFTVQTLAAHDIAITTGSTIGQRVAIGTDAVWAFSLRSKGLRAVDNVTVYFSWIGAADVNVSIDPPIGPGCTRSFFELVCNFGTLQPGETRPITLRGRVNVEGDLRIDINAQITGLDDNFNDNQLSVGIQARLGNDARMVVTRTSSATFEGHDEDVLFGVEATGVNASDNVVITATLPPGFIARSVFVDNQDCGIQTPTPNVAVCTIPRIPPGEMRHMNLRYTAGAPGVYTGTLSVAASADVNSSNDSAPINFTISPNVDGALLAPPEQILRTDVPVQLPFTVTSNKYTLPDARVDFSWSGLADVTITAPGANCTGTSTGHSCSFGTLAPNSSIPFTMQLRATSPPWAFLQVRLSSPAETDPGNNGVFYTMRVYAPGDGAIVIPQPIPDVTLGVRSSIVFDVNVSAEINNVSLELQFDPTRLGFPLLGSLCQPTTTGMRCDLGVAQLPQSSRWTLSFTPNALGSTPISVRVLSINDANSANDMQTAMITVVAPPPPPPTPPTPPTPPPATNSGGGGGGPISWPLACALALLAMTRLRLATRARHWS